MPTPSYDCSNYSVDPALSKWAAEAGAAELKAHQTALPPAGISSNFIHALGVVPKGPKFAPVGARIIHDYARPAGRAHNDHVKYVARPFMRVKDFVERLQEGSWMAKVDIAGYFYHIGVHPEHWCRTAHRASWRILEAAGVPPPPHLQEGQEVELWSTRVQFGLRHAPEVADRFTQAIVRVMRRLGFSDCYGMLDDFSVHHADQRRCQLAWHVLMAVLRHLGFRIQGRKCQGPSQEMVLLGVMVSSLRMDLQVPDDKVTNMRGLISDMLVLPNNKPTKRSVDQIVGKLNWAADFIHGGRIYLNAIRRAGLRVAKPHHQCYLNRAARRALHLWREALLIFNGSCKIIKPTHRSWHHFQT
jgi:hypothetical protein